MHKVAGRARLLGQLPTKVVLLVNLLFKDQKLVFFFCVGVFVGGFYLEPLHLPVLICHNEMLRGHDRADRLVGQVECGSDPRRLARNMKHFTLVGA